MAKAPPKPPVPQAFHVYYEIRDQDGAVVATGEGDNPSDAYEDLDARVRRGGYRWRTAPPAKGQPTTTTIAIAATLTRVTQCLGVAIGYRVRREIAAAVGRTYEDALGSLDIVEDNLVDAINEAAATIASSGRPGHG